MTIRMKEDGGNGGEVNESGRARGVAKRWRVSDGHHVVDSDSEAGPGYSACSSIAEDAETTLP